MKDSISLRLSFHFYQLSKHKNWLFSLMGQVFQGVLTGVQLGLYSDKTIQGLTDKFYSTTPLYVDKEYNDRGLYPPEQKLVDSLPNFPQNVLITSCGAGREAIYFAKRSVQVTAVEGNPLLYNQARNNLKPYVGLVSVLNIPFNEQIYSSEKFDLIIVGWNSYGHILSKNWRKKLLRNIFELSLSDTRVIISCYPSTRQRKLVRWMSHGLSRVIKMCLLKPSSNLLLHFFGDRPWPFASIDINRGSLESEFASAGFKVTSALADYPIFLLTRSNYKLKIIEKAA